MTRLVVVYALVLGIAGCSRSLDFERMRQQSRGDVFEASARFDNGMTMRVPPRGAVPAGERDPAVSPAVTPELIARGRHHYDTQCAVCHGTDGSGSATMAANLPGNPMLSLLTDQTTSRTDSELFDIVARGRNRMPAFDWALSAGDRWAAIAYLRTLRERGR